MVNTRAFVECKNITIKVTFRTICVSTVNIVFVKIFFKEIGNRHFNRPRLQVKNAT
jgi:hypothetical protein